MSMRTPLGRVRGLGSARNGTHHWWLQRVTAVALVPLTVWFVASIVGLVGADYETVTLWVAQPLVAVLLILFLLTGFYHLKLGLQVVVEDYVHHEGAKVATQMLITFGCFLVGALSIFAVLKIAFTS
ncbi:MAG: succinate dehydrogenase, hydrophobic membrane anchor protein [Alphaproteobacteria bacterium]|nr:MAG: succinate dehydrogenase, hydrophobic membrane anchor protein [Alphaproteobacteria bacterium]